MKKKRRMNWENVMYGIVFITCTSLILKDLFMVTLYGWLSNKHYCFTFPGMIIDSLALMFGLITLSILMEESKKA